MDVVGDLADLLPGPALPYVDPEDASPAEREDVLLRSVRALALEGARLRAVLAERDAELARRAAIILGQNATIEALKAELPPGVRLEPIADV